MNKYILNQTRTNHVEFKKYIFKSNINFDEISKVTSTNITNEGSFSLKTIKQKH